MDTRIRPSSARVRIRPPKRRTNEPVPPDPTLSAESAVPSESVDGTAAKEQTDAEGSSGLLLLSIVSAVLLAWSCYWLFVPYGTHPIAGGTVTVNWTFSAVERHASRIDDRLTIRPRKSAYFGHPWVEVPDDRISLIARSARCLRPSSPKKTTDGWRIDLHPRQGCEDAALVLQMPKAHTVGRHFRTWVQFPWYSVNETAASTGEQPVDIEATFRAPHAQAVLTRETENLVYSAYSSPARSSEYNCRAVDASADVVNDVKCSAHVDGKENQGNFFVLNLPGWSYRFETPSYPALSVAIPSFLGAVFGATISGLPPFVPWRSRRKGS